VSERSELLSPPATANFRGHIAELDSIRGIGICLVLVNHFWPRTGSNPMYRAIYELGQLGWIAMDGFFVLSGFLITGILLDTRSRPDYFRNYYIRRSLRIFPLYYAALVLALLAAKLVRGGMEYTALQHWGSPAWFFFYLGNIKVAWAGEQPAPLSLAVLWSLQIEEQFYLLFPLAVRYLRRDHLVRLLWCLVFLSPAFRLFFYLWNPNNLVIQYVLLPCHMEGLALGALIAIRFRSGSWEIPRVPLAIGTVVLMVVTCIGSYLSKPAIVGYACVSNFARLPGYSIASFAFAGVVLLLILSRGSRQTWLLRSAPIGYMATISYGTYLLHSLAPELIRYLSQRGIHLGYPRYRFFFSAVALSIIAASISWFGFERPLTRLKDRLAPSRVPSGPRQAASSSSAPEMTLQPAVASADASRN
jgi:peptidoglycan/LPS O-acetylase OafA/YrhL